MKNLDNFSGLTSFCGGLLALFVFPFIGGISLFSLIFFFFLILFLPYLFCSCQCERKYLFHSIGGLGALTGASLGWVFSFLVLEFNRWGMLYVYGGYGPTEIFPIRFIWNFMSIPIFAFLFSRYYCMTYKEKDDSPIFKKFLIIFAGTITYLMFFLWCISFPTGYLYIWFLFTPIFWSLLLIIPEYIATKSIPHYLNNLGVALIALLPLGIEIIDLSPSWMYMAVFILVPTFLLLLIFLPLFSLLYCIKKNEKTYFYDAISVFCVANICDILVIATLPLVTTVS